MSYPASPGNINLPAPCIVDTGIIVSKHDMRRILSDLGRVCYTYTQGNEILSQDEGYVMDVFADAQQSTLVTNHSLYLNVCSFDYLELSRSSTQQSCLTLVQDNRRLQLIPLSNPLKRQGDRTMNAAALEAMVAEVLSASIDMRLDDEENFYL